jgi:hypothetical protein
MKFAHCSNRLQSRVGPCFLILSSSLIFLSACAPVQPWERGRLAQPQMALDGDVLLSAMDEHVYGSKEAASGGGGAAGGGCGCN